MSAATTGHPGVACDRCAIQHGGERRQALGVGGQACDHTGPMGAVKVESGNADLDGSQQPPAGGVPLSKKSEAWLDTAETP